MNTIIHITLQAIDVKDNTYIAFDKEVNDKGPKFKVGDHVRISNYKNIFAEGYAPNWSEEVFVIKKGKNTVPWRTLQEHCKFKRIAKNKSSRI